jgi:hypothetical protein
MQRMSALKMDDGALDGAASALAATEALWSSALTIAVMRGCEMSPISLLATLTYLSRTVTTLATSESGGVVGGVVGGGVVGGGVVGGGVVGGGAGGGGTCEDGSTCGFALAILMATATPIPTPVATTPASMAAGR